MVDLLLDDQFEDKEARVLTKVTYPVHGSAMLSVQCICF